MSAILDSRAANALFAEARPSETLADWIPVLAVLDLFARRFGGLWVGGTATLTDEALIFEPNRMNRLVHEDGSALRLDLPLAAIDAVSTRSGFVSGIIDVKAQGALFSLRSFRAAAFAARIEDARLRRAAG